MILRITATGQVADDASTSLRIVPALAHCKPSWVLPTPVAPATTVSVPGRALRQDGGPGPQSQRIDGFRHSILASSVAAHGRIGRLRRVVQLWIDRRDRGKSQLRQVLASESRRFDRNAELCHVSRTTESIVATSPRKAKRRTGRGDFFINLIS